MNFIKNIHKIIDKKPDFDLRQLNFITILNYYIDVNSEFENVSYLEICFVLESNVQNEKLDVFIKFTNVSSLEVKGFFGGGYNQILGFEIIDYGRDEWEKATRYFINDYENSTLKFYCESVEILSVD
ncbi:hypothetical protein [Paenibacillus ihumii]|uniref:hypothetical protein n=1 Tax=Paenibacillus ihumii TaxID=687436 RepID=UPI0006D7D032|nr:hypothetical protein [Paenibacillus ihumii]